MSSTNAPAEMRTQILEGLTGATGDPKSVADAARACAERALPAVVAALAEMLAAPVSFECGAVEICRLADSRPADDSCDAMSVAAADTSPDALLMTVDGAGIALMLSAMFGADDSLPVVPLSRPPSAIEADIAARLFDAFARAFNGSGERAMNVRFPLGVPVTGTDIGKLALRDGPAARITIDMIFGANRGLFKVTIPQRVLVEMRGDATAGTRTSAAAWRERFNDEVMRSQVRLEASIPLGRLTLGQLACLAPGQVLELDENAPAQAQLASRDRVLFVCEMGKLGQNYTVRVTRPFDAQQDFVEGLLSA